MTPTFQNLSDEKRSRVLRAAGEEFALRGYDAAKMSSIAQGAGVSVGALYKYFENKQDLYLGVIHHSVAGMEQLLTALSRTDEDIREARIIQASGARFCGGFVSLQKATATIPEFNEELWERRTL